MSLTDDFDFILTGQIPAAFKQFQSDLDRHWITTALEVTGTASVRRRRIPASLVIWLVIGMALFRDRSIAEVVAHLDLVLPTRGNKGIAPSASAQARQRLGSEPMEFLAEVSGSVWSEEADGKYRWRGLALYAVDGTTFRVEDTAQNRERFGLPGSNPERGQSGYPQVRMVALQSIRSRIVLAAAMGPCKGNGTGEVSLAGELWEKVPDDSLLILDKGFQSYRLLYRLQVDETEIASGNRHWLVATKKNSKFKTITVLPDGSELVEVRTSPESRKLDPSLPKIFRARLIAYQVKGFRERRLLTSLLDHEQYPAQEFAVRYHERWEIELSYAEIKVDMLERREALRSKKPDLVLQEIWGLLIAYNLVRRHMARVAEKAEVPPYRISFRHSMHFVEMFCIADAWTMAPGNAPKRLERLLKSSSLFVLPQRRSERRYPRHVKIKMSKFKRNTGKPDSASGKNEAKSE